jgi:YD repeat-containing protein
MILTREFLHKVGACKQGIDFCERNKLFGFDLDKFHEIKGDYNSFVEWLDDNVISKILVFNEYGNIIEEKYKKTDEWLGEWHIKKFYDNQQNLIRIERINGIWNEFTYDSNGNIIAELWKTGHRIERKYDDRNNLIEELSLYGISLDDHKEFTYNDLNQLISERSHVNFSCITLEYDERGNNIKQSWDNGDYVIWEYDDNGNIIKENNQSDEWCIWEYDDHFNPTKITFSDSYVIEYNTEYYPNGQLKKHGELFIPYIEQEIL